MAVTVPRTGERLSFEWDEQGRGIFCRAAVKVDGKLHMIDYLLTPEVMDFGRLSTLGMFRHVRTLMLGNLRAFGGRMSFKAAA